MLRRVTPDVRPVRSIRSACAVILCLDLALSPVLPAFADPVPAVAPVRSASDLSTATPIKHVIVIVGENRSFDHIFATYQPQPGEQVRNLLSEHIVTIDGKPGAQFQRAHQYAADVTGSAQYDPSPRHKTLYRALPAPIVDGPTDVCRDNGLCTLEQVQSTENTLPAQYQQYLLSGGTGLTGKVPDSRISGVSATAPYSRLQPGPYQLTNGDTFTDASYAASPVHRFYQMRQQLDCNAAYATRQNPSGCLADLFAWVETTAGAGSDGKKPPANFSVDYMPDSVTTGEGATALGFYNMARGDAPYTRYLADHYALSDNYHQPAMGGTGLDSIMLFFGDAIWFADAKGDPATPPHQREVATGSANAGVVDEIENPDPMPGTNNWYMEDGYGGGGMGKPSFGGGAYTNCADQTQPGVKAVVNYLQSLNPRIDPKCQPDHYYLVNNYNPGYFGDGSNAYTDNNDKNSPFTIPPTQQHSIADVLLANGTSWKSYGDHWNRYLLDRYQLNQKTVGSKNDQYCNICTGFQYQTQVMADTSIREQHMQDLDNLYADIASGNMPAVAFVKPSGWVDGHPATSKWQVYEGFVRKIVDAVQSKPDLWRNTAIFVTADEGGGYYDSGYVQPLDFFGDGTRIPLIVVSPYVKPGHVSHQYSDHVSVLKFIERNWHLPTVSNRSRDNLPNPVSDRNNLYVPRNSPAIGDLFDLFDFHIK